MTPSTYSDMERIARRRRQLSIDYLDLTRTSLISHTGETLGALRLMSRCFAKVRRQFLTHYLGSAPAWRIRLRQISKKRAFPDFCIIGPLKSGTSDLAVTIMSHPNVLHPLVKEPSSLDPLAWKPLYPTLSSVQRHARRHGVALCPFVGPYLHFLDIPLMLATFRPNMKIVINLRNPVDLVFSQWKWDLLHRDKQVIERVPFLATFPAYVDKSIDSFPDISAGVALHRSIYATSVSHWIQTFGERNVRIFDAEEYFTDRNTYIERLERFVGLPHVALPPRLPVTNQSPLNVNGPDPDTSAKLRQFFEPYNRRLWDIIGTEYLW